MKLEDYINSIVDMDRSVTVRAPVAPLTSIDSDWYAVGVSLAPSMFGVVFGDIVSAEGLMLQTKIRVMTFDTDSDGKKLVDVDLAFTGRVSMSFKCALTPFLKNPDKLRDIQGTDTTAGSKSEKSLHDFLQASPVNLERVITSLSRTLFH